MLVVVPFAAVTTTVIVLLPTFKLIAPDAEPEVTAVPFTVTVAPEPPVTVGKTVIEVVVLPTAIAYEFVPEVNEGVQVPADEVKVAKVATDDAARVTVNV